MMLKLIGLIFILIALFFAMGFGIEVERMKGPNANDSVRTTAFFILVIATVLAVCCLI